MPTTPAAETTATPKKGGLFRWVGGIVAQQREMVFGARHRQVLAETKRTLEGVRKLKVQPTRVETFEEAAVRLGWSNELLESQLRRFKSAHLILYAAAGLFLVYATYLGLNVGKLAGTGALIAALGAAVNGYLHGFRAWQIEHRNLIRLQDALRLPATYLVL